MKYVQKLVGENLYLSPMNPEDAETYVAWLNQLSISQNLGSATKVFSLSGERNWIEQNSSETQFAIVRKEDNRLLGNCGVQAVDHLHQKGEIGLFIGEEENRNKGYGAEVLELLLDYCFLYLNLHNVQLKVFSFNKRAIHTYEKVGFQIVGRRREAYFCKGKFHDEIFMDILAEEHTTKYLLQ